MNQSNRTAVERIVKQANHMLNESKYYNSNEDAREGILMMADGALSALRAIGRHRVQISTAAQETDRWVGFVMNGRGTYDLDSVPLPVTVVTVSGFLDGLQAGGTTNMVDDR